MKISEEDTGKVYVNQLPEQAEYSYILYAAQDTVRYLTPEKFDRRKSEDANNTAWRGITDLMAQCIARGMRLQEEKQHEQTQA